MRLAQALRLNEMRCAARGVGCSRKEEAAEPGIVASGAGCNLAWQRGGAHARRELAAGWLSPSSQLPAVGTPDGITNDSARNTHKLTPTKSHAHTCAYAPSIERARFGFCLFEVSRCM